MLGLLLILVIVAIISAILYHYVRTTRALINISGPKTYPLIGDLELIRQRHDPITYFHKTSKRYRKIFKSWMGPKVFVTLSDPDLITKVLAAPQLLQKPELFYNVIGLPNGLIGSKYEIWRRHRKIINPTFNSKILYTFIPVFKARADELVNSLSKFVGGEEIDLFAHVINGTMETIFTTTLGSESLTRSKVESIVILMHRIADFVSKRTFNPLLLPQTLYRLTTSYQEEMKTRATLYSAINSLIGTRRKALLSQQPEVDQNYYKPQNFIDQMISLGYQMTDEEIKDECYTMVAGGSESTALTVAYTILLLAMHPLVQEKAAQEVLEFFKLYDTLDAENLNHLPYLDLVVKETLRLTTVIPIIGREPMQDFDLGPCVLKPGMVVCINIFSLHRSPEVWGSDAEQFRPERFVDTPFDPNAFIPFSGGVRNCVGQRYALLSVKIILISLIRAFKFRTTLKLANLEFAFAVSMKLRNKHWVKLESRS